MNRLASCAVGFVVAVSLPALIVVRAEPAPGAQRGQPQAAPAGPMAPEVYKNIQVLTEVPADQLDLTMQYISAATGLQCRSCHVRDQATGEFAYEKDDVRSKQTARQMIRMVNAINAGDFGVRAACATCHAGRNRPPGLQLATMATPEEIAAFTARQGGAGRGQGGAARGQGGAGRGQGRGRQQGPAPPAAADVVAKYIEAVGGAAAIDKLQSRVMTGTLTDRLGQSVSFTIEEKAPDRYRQTLKSADGTSMQGFDGKAGWLEEGGQVSDLAGFVLQKAMRIADLTLPKRLRDQSSGLQAGRSTRLDGRDVNLLQMASSGTTERFYFDAETGLPVRHLVSTRTPMGALTEQIDYSDYRAVSGVKMPFVITYTNWSAVDTYKVSDIKANQPLADSLFVKPTTSLESQK